MDGKNNFNKWLEAYEIAKSQLELHSDNLIDKKSEVDIEKFGIRYGLNFSEAQNYADSFRLNDLNSCYSDKIEETEKELDRELTSLEKNAILEKCEEEFSADSYEKYAWSFFVKNLEKNPEFKKYNQIYPEFKKNNSDIISIDEQLLKNEADQKEKKYVVTDKRGGEVVLVCGKNECDVAKSLKDEAMDAGIPYEETIDVRYDSNYEIELYENWLENHSEDEIDRECIF